MNESSVQAHLESCRERVLSQDATNASYSNKAMGVTTLSLTLFGVGISGFSGGILETVLVVILGICVLLVSLLGLGLIMRDRGWEIACDLSESERTVQSSENTADFLFELSKSYRDAVEANQKMLDEKASWFSFVIVATLVEVICFAILLSL